MFQVTSNKKRGSISELVRSIRLGELQLGEVREAQGDQTKRDGFTLLELLVVITIIGLLSSVGLASYTRAQARARDAKRQSDITSLRNSLEIYYSENNVYPDTGGAWQDISTALSVLVPDFTKTLPTDPGGEGLPYLYRSVTNQGYCLGSKLETATSTQTTCTVSLQTNYNYGVGNP
uniref:Prepilin-type N-terminal cleavage/methylation domain-containing protein n=1 Tax=candidate division WWE3 bacterium TaxID=2053526 RepID=A0A831Z1D1_UNCKA